MTVNRIISHVFLQPSLQQVDEAVMEQLVADHPYFAAGRLLLAKKVYQQTGNLQGDAVKKALLYTDQPHYVYQLITGDMPENTLPEEDATTSIAAEIAQDIAALPVVEDRLAPVIPEDALPQQEPEHTMAAIHNGTEIPAPEATTAVTTETVIPGESITATIAEEIAQETTLPVVEDRIAPVIPEDALPQQDIIHHTPLAVADFEQDTHVHPANASTVMPPPAPVDLPVAEEEDPSPGPIKIFPLAVDTTETELTFQPLYTDDYFAYKRLKNPEEADELSIQGAAEMRSFTSWLRQMKDNFVGKTSKDWYQQQLHRIYEEDEEPEVSETVEKMAMNSIVFNNDIVSETLAEIWIRQHQYGNAIKIYQKLSLLNPDKNAYFAQKILELKSLTDKK
ncbi:hypothetical protein HGH93_11700 [Chitinophaga polysaccharea]|uniref:hypothetical protein n=1 Tax=Chitinophaga TaxID=79328 RepID=UPI0014551A02|nr:MULTISPECIES: hypothetical protein [Chitinophaga]NLR58770.1 hypothetical protein [Chitinophaga polysaccharea]NLU91301.1 hypothetical protein [Chitinophaga sp. Ak27]